MILALDCSTTCTGFAFGGEQDGSPRGGIWKLPGADPLNLDDSLGKLSEAILGIAKFIGARHVCIEAPMRKIDRFHSAQSAASLLQITGAARAAAWRAKATTHLYAVGTIRAYFIGNGGLPGPEGKRLVQQRCNQLGWPYQNADHADANAVWAYGMSQLYPRWSPKQARAA